jgi:hypothetical protein
VASTARRPSAIITLPMIRTRDFLLFLCTVFFLFSGIAATVVTDVVGLAGGQAGTVILSDPAQLPPPVEQVGAVVSESPEIDREANLLAMREQIAALNLTSSPVTETPPDLSGDDNQDAAPRDGVAGLQECSTYSEVAWADMPGVQFRVVEGARILYRPIPAPLTPAVVATSGSSTTPTPVAPSEVVLAQLPLREQPMLSPTCIPHDVVGVALDGSLIRNGEAALYAVFGADTLVGYALDGFPIYGVSGLPVDDCGGATVGGAYRYYLNAERETVLNCYAAVPVGL